MAVVSSSGLRFMFPILVHAFTYVTHDPMQILALWHKTNYSDSDKGFQKKKKMNNPVNTSNHC